MTRRIHHYWGGLRTTRELAAICRTFGVGLSMHSNTHMGISLAVTVANLDHSCDTHYPWWPTDEVITERHTFSDGRLTVSDAPGLGIALDHDALKRLHRRWLEDDGTMRDRDDAAAMREPTPTGRSPRSRAGEAAAEAPNAGACPFSGRHPRSAAWCPFRATPRARARG